MLYTTEEAAVICGFLNAHLAQAGVEVSVRKRNAAFQRGVIMGTLQPGLQMGGECSLLSEALLVAVT